MKVTYPEYKKNNRVNTTVTKQLAMYVLFYSPLQMAADLPENYEQHTDLFQFIRDVPADWDKTLMLNGEIGEFVTMARKDRNSDDWYLGSMTNEKSRDLGVPLAFLSKGRTYAAEIYRDGEAADWKQNPYAHTIEKQTVTRATVLALHLAPGGGEAIRFRLLPETGKAVAESNN